jgi:predicted metal-dependent hydrolase
MKKSHRIASFVESLDTGAHPDQDPHYVGYFVCFNDQRYYEAHDVLEQLWLKSQGAHHQFFKGLIQLAGAFVHLKKQYLRPGHAKDGRRLRPAWRLFRIAQSNLEPFAPKFLGLDVADATRLCAANIVAIEESEFRKNPWNPEKAPRLTMNP